MSGIIIRQIYDVDVVGRNVCSEQDEPLSSKIGLIAVPSGRLNEINLGFVEIYWIVGVLN